ncbi:MAG: preprotein translocase subunit SecY [bacterium]|jgi:preprotein translocase subunit SecY|nr:preprotein translocase subunit SecY [bacterium]
MIDAILNIFRIPDLRKRVVFTLVVLALLQIGHYIPIPGIDPILLHTKTQSNAGGLFSLFDLFAGGALSKCSIFALGIMPYISASIILQLLTVTSPYLEELSKKGEEGRKKINQYTRYLTVVITAFQAFMISFSLENPQGMWGDIVYNPGWNFRLMTMMSMTAGSMIIMWMGEMITERGIGNGISLIIFANIVARIPMTVTKTFGLLSIEEMSPITALVTFAVLVLVIAGVVVIQFGQRRVPIKRGRMVRGGRMYGGQANSYLPLRINTAGVIPVIFAAAILILPATFVQFTQPLADNAYFSWVHNSMVVISGYLLPGMWLYTFVYVGLIIFFCYFYTAITFNPKDVAENLQKYGSTIPGYSHGKRTEEYLTRILNRITLAGAIALAIIAVIPDMMNKYMGVPDDLASLLGGTSIIIVVGVALDTVSQIENHLRVRNYDGFRKRGRTKGRSGM